MLERPKVSFCFTTFKRFDYLQKTLESVKNQTFSDFEVIVSDNDPEQSGKEVVEGFDQRFKYFPNETNLGMKKSFNKSLDRSSGEFIVMIADDDPVYPDMLETLLNLEKNILVMACTWEVVTGSVQSRILPTFIIVRWV
jgi:glycosyltransferase involved in cell wall biosynthesis